MHNFDKHETLLLLGKKITVLRESQKLTKVQLSFELGIDEKHLRRIEKGELNIGVLLLLKLADTLDVSTDELLGKV